MDLRHYLKLEAVKMNTVEEKAYADRFNWTQPILGAVVLLAMLFWGNHLKVTNVDKKIYFW